MKDEIEKVYALFRESLTFSEMSTTDIDALENVFDFARSEHFDVLYRVTDMRHKYISQQVGARELTVEKAQHESVYNTGINDAALFYLSVRIKDMKEKYRSVVERRMAEAIPTGVKITQLTDDQRRQSWENIDKY